MARKEFYKRVKGPMDNYEDWYILDDTQDAKLLVIHQWSHVTHKLAVNSGSNTYTVEEFLGDPAVSTDAQRALRAYLNANMV